MLADLLNISNSCFKLLPSNLNFALTSFLAIPRYLFISASVNNILNTPWKASWYLKGEFAPVYSVPLTVLPPAISFKFKTNAPTLSPPAFKLSPSVAMSSILIKSGKFLLAHAKKVLISSTSVIDIGAITLLAVLIISAFLANNDWYSLLSLRALDCSFLVFPFCNSALSNFILAFISAKGELITLVAWFTVSTPPSKTTNVAIVELKTSWIINSLGVNALVFPSLTILLTIWSSCSLGNVENLSSAIASNSASLKSNILSSAFSAVIISSDFVLAVVNSGPTGIAFPSASEKGSVCTNTAEVFCDKFSAACVMLGSANNCILEGLVTDFITFVDVKDNSCAIDASLGNDWVNWLGFKEIFWFSRTWSSLNLSSNIWIFSGFSSFVSNIVFLSNLIVCNFFPFNFTCNSILPQGLICKEMFTPLLFLINNCWLDVFSELHLRKAFNSLDPVGRRVSFPAGNWAITAWAWAIVFTINSLKSKGVADKFT